MLDDRRFRIPQDWHGKPVVIVAGGGSFTAAQSRLIGLHRSLVKVIAVNDAVWPCWYADVLYACDHDWWDWHAPALREFRGEKICMGVPRLPAGDMLLPADPKVRFVERDGVEGMPPHPDRIASGGNSGYQAVQLAAKRGSQRILLCGIDMDGKQHWFGEHPLGPLRRTPSWDVRRQTFNGLATILKERGVKVTNCSPGSALKAFPAGDLATELERIANGKEPIHPEAGQEARAAEGAGA